MPGFLNSTNYLDILVLIDTVNKHYKQNKQTKPHITKPYIMTKKRKAIKHKFEGERAAKPDRAPFGSESERPTRTTTKEEDDGGSEMSNGSPRCSYPMAGRSDPENPIHMLFDYMIDVWKYGI